MQTCWWPLSDHWSVHPTSPHLSGFECYGVLNSLELAALWSISLLSSINALSETNLTIAWMARSRVSLPYEFEKKQTLELPMQINELEGLSYITMGSTHLFLINSIQLKSPYHATHSKWRPPTRMGPRGQNRSQYRSKQCLVSTTKASQPGSDNCMLLLFY